MPGTDDPCRFVKPRRQQLGISRRRAAKRAGLSRQVWTEIELGYRSASDDTLARMSTALELPPGSFRALEVEVTDPELVAIRQEMVEMIEQLTTRERLGPTVLDDMHARIVVLQDRLRAAGEGR